MVGDRGALAVEVVCCCCDALMDDDYWMMMCRRFDAYIHKKKRRAS
jgi:hypothetical protein